MEEGSLAQQVENLETGARQEADNSYADMRQAELDVEKARIKAEERMNERNAERDENVAAQYTEVDRYKSMLDEMFSRFNDLFSTRPQTEVNVSHEANPEIPTIPATEDTEEEEIPEENPVEGIEEIGKTEETNIEKPVNTLEEETSNAGNSKRGRKRRGRR